MIERDVGSWNSLGSVGPPTLAKTSRHDCIYLKNQVRLLDGPITPKTVELKSELREFAVVLDWVQDRFARRSEFCWNVGGG